MVTIAMLERLYLRCCGGCAIEVRLRGAGKHTTEAAIIGREDSRDVRVGIVALYMGF